MKTVENIMREQGWIQVLCQVWEERERGWGCRPGGYSLHRDKAALDAYIKEYWADMPDTAPDEYDRPHGNPYSVYVSEKAYARLLEKNGVRVYAEGSPSQGEVLEDRIDPPQPECVLEDRIDPPQLECVLVAARRLVQAMNAASLAILLPGSPYMSAMQHATDLVSAAYRDLAETIRIVDKTQV